MTLHPAQSQIAKDTHRFRVVSCGRRFGKTYLSVLELIGVAVSGDDKHCCYIAPTYQQARDIAWNELCKTAEPVIVSKNESRLELTIRTQEGGTSTIILRGWESVDTLRGQFFDFIVIDEVSSMRYFEAGWKEVIRPTLSDKRGSVLFISTPRGYNHFHELFIREKQDTDYKSFHFTTYDNPHIPKDEVDKARIEVGENRFAQEYLADFRKIEGLVYSEFDRNRHVTEVIPRNVIEKFAGVDFGFTNPTAIVEVWKNNDGIYTVVAEWYKTGKTNAEVVEYAKTLDVQAFYPDPAEPDRIQDMRNAGLNCREVNKDVKKGVDAMMHALRNKTLLIHQSCTNLIWEIENYRYKDKKNSANEPEEPVKENDHLLDALRYVIFMQQPVIIDRVKSAQHFMAQRRLSVNENV
jgi:PBSX family phage terminase large subunit